MNSHSTLRNIFEQDKYADRIFSEHYELFVHHDRTWVESEQDADIMQVRARINTIPSRGNNKVGAEKYKLASMKASIMRMKSFRL